MLRQLVRAEKGTKKFHDDYVGPFYVVDVISDVNYRICDKPTAQPRIVHHDSMKPVERREGEDLQWVFDQSRTLERKRAAAKETHAKEFTEIFDRHKSLENSAKKEPKKRKPRTPKTKPIPEQGERVVEPVIAPQEEPQPKRKRGRPKKNPEQPKVEGQQELRRSERLKNK